MAFAKKVSILVILLIVGLTVFLIPASRHALLSWVGLDTDRAASLVLYGNVDIREVEMSFRQPGRLVKTHVDEGDKVSTGTLLAELDPTTFKDQLAAATADVMRVRATLDKLYHGNRPQDIAQAAAAVEQARATLRNAELDYQRKLALLKSQNTSQSTVDTASAVRDAAAAALTLKQEALDLQKAGARNEDIAAGEAALAHAEAALAGAKTALDDTRLVSPADATVLSRIREAGSMVNSSTPVYALSLRDPVYIRAYVSEPDLGRLAPGTKVTVQTDSSDKIYHGQIGFISPRAEFTPKSVETTDLRTDLVYRLRIIVQDSDDGLRQGMPVTIHVPISVHKNTAPITG